MALQQDYTINLDYVLTTNINADGIENKIVNQYTIKEAYFKIVNISPIIVIDKPTTLSTESEEDTKSTIYLEVYDKDKTNIITTIKVNGFTPSNVDGSENIIKQAYTFLKTTSEFKNAIDVLEKNQSNT
jgi:hypothetical protein|nr:MAG TPA: hypothetical protein [Caudoviricetes sp.]